MNIVYYLNSFPKLSESFILNEIVELDKRGHNVAIFAHQDPEEDILHDELKNRDFEIYYSDIPSYTDFYHLIDRKIFSKALVSEKFGSGSVQRRAKHTYYAIHLMKFFEKLDFEPDLIHSHFAFDDRKAVQMVSEEYNIPWTVEVHAADIFKKKNKGDASKVIKDSKRVITVSEYNKRYLKDEFGLEKPIDVVPVSIRPEKFEPQGLEEKNKIVSVGRLVEKKGFKYGIEAFAKLKEEHPELQYNIIGKGELRSELEKLAEELEVSDDVNFLGHVSDQRLKTEMEEAKAFLLPCVKAEDGDMDGVPTVLKESMSLETVCVSTKISGIPELIQTGETGLLAESREVNELSDKLSKLLESDDLRKRMGKNARTKIEEFHSTSKVGKLIEKSMEKVINDYE